MIFILKTLPLIRGNIICRENVLEIRYMYYVSLKVIEDTVCDFIENFLTRVKQNQTTGEFRDIDNPSSQITRQKALLSALKNSPSRILQQKYRLL